MSIVPVSVQKLPKIKTPFRSKFNLSFPSTFTTYPDIVKPICKSIKLEVGDTVDVAIDLKILNLYLTSPVIDSLQADVYTVFINYSQVSLTYKRVKGERTSVVTDKKDYVMPRITTTYPLIAGNFDITDPSSPALNRVNLHVASLEWEQDGELIKPMIFSANTGKNVEPSFLVAFPSQGTPYQLGAYIVGGDDFAGNEALPDYMLGFALGSLPDALGYPVGLPCLALTAVDILGYYLACDYYFRNPEIFDSIVGLVPDVDVNRPWNIWCDWQGMNPIANYKYGSVCAFYAPQPEQYVLDKDTLKLQHNTVNNLTGLAPGGFYRASRKPDYLALGLAAPTYNGIEVNLPSTFSADVSDNMPVVGNGKALGLENKYTSQEGVVAGLTTNPDGVMYASYPIPEGDLPQARAGSVAFANMYYGVSTDPEKSGLVVDGSSFNFDFNPGTIQELRTLFQLNKYYEIKNVSGKYFNQLMANFFGIEDHTPDPRFPQLLSVLSGSFNYESNVSTAATADNPQGNITMNAVCQIKGRVAKKTALEDSLIQIYLVIRQPSIAFENRIDKRFFEFREMDFMNPLFARLSDQPIKNYEVHYPAVKKNIFKPTSQGGLLSIVTQTGTVTPARTNVNTTSPTMKKVYDDMFDVNSYQERYGELKYSFAQVGDMFRTRAGFMPMFTQPAYDKYVWNSKAKDFIINLDYSYNSQEAIAYKVRGTLSDWNYDLSFDNPTDTLVNKKSNLGIPDSDTNISGLAPTRVDPRLSKSITPFGKNSASTFLPPFQCQAMIYVSVQRTLPVNTLPGLADHM